MAQDQASLPDRIVVDPEILVGKPVIAGTRIPVSLVLNLLAHGYDVNRTLEAYPMLTREDVQAALAYAQERLDRRHPSPLARSDH